MFKHSNRLTWWAAAMLPVMFLACGTVREIAGPKGPSWPLRVSADIPSAQGIVKVLSTQGPKQKVRIEVQYLPPPDRVSAHATTYVVWLVPAGENEPRNFGALRLGVSLKGELEIQTPFPEFEVFVTAEATATVTRPTNRQLLMASVRSASRATP